AISRRAEVPAMVAALERFRPVRSIEAPATIDGGDVLVAGRQVFVGRSSRTNSEAVAELRRIVGRFGYTVCELAVDDCLHLKSAVPSIGGGLLLASPSLIDTAAFAGFEIVEVDPREPAAANALRLRDRVIVAAAFPHTAERIAARGIRVEAVDASELAKAEGA